MLAPQCAALIASQSSISFALVWLILLAIIRSDQRGEKIHVYPFLCAKVSSRFLSSLSAYDPYSNAEKLANYYRVV